MTDTIEGRAYLYSFDFPKFRDRAEETIRPVNIFHCQGVCWKFRFSGEIRLYSNAELLWAGMMTDSEANGYDFLTPHTFTPEDTVCVEVIDVSRRWFRWFRPNSAHVTLEGLEQDPATIQ